MNISAVKSTIKDCATLANAGFKQEKYVQKRLEANTDRIFKACEGRSNAYADKVFKKVEEKAAKDFVNIKDGLIQTVKANKSKALVGAGILALGAVVKTIVKHAKGKDKDTQEPKTEEAQKA